MDGFGLDGKGDAVSAAGALIYYVGSTLRHSLAHVRSLRIMDSGDALVLDNSTVRHLQLLPYGDVQKGATLLGVLDVTKTPMGARTMRNWISRPLARSADVNRRLDAVGLYVRERMLLTDLRGPEVFPASNWKYSYLIYNLPHYAYWHIFLTYRSAGRRGRSAPTKGHAAFRRQCCFIGLPANGRMWASSPTNIPFVRWE